MGDGGRPLCLEFLDFLAEELPEKRVAEVARHAVFCKLTTCQVRSRDGPGALLITSHEGNSGHDHAADRPTRRPTLLVKVGKSGANRLADLEPATGRKEHEPRRCKGIILMQLQHSVVISSFIRAIQSEDAEVEVQCSLSRHPYVLWRVVMQPPFLFLQTHQC